MDLERKIKQFLTLKQRRPYVAAYWVAEHCGVSVAEVQKFFPGHPWAVERANAIIWFNKLVAWPYPEIVEYLRTFKGDEILVEEVAAAINIRGRCLRGAEPIGWSASTIRRAGKQVRIWRRDSPVKRPRARSVRRGMLGLYLPEGWQTVAALISATSARVEASLQPWQRDLSTEEVEPGMTVNDISAYIRYEHGRLLRDMADRNEITLRAPLGFSPHVLPNFMRCAVTFADARAFCRALAVDLQPRAEQSQEERDVALLARVRMRLTIK